jgi:hypothetical protein
MSAWLSGQGLRYSRDVPPPEPADGGAGLDDGTRTPPSVRRARRSAAAAAGPAAADMPSPDRSVNAFRAGNERLYEAYNDLHSLAQDFQKPFDAPAILVVGHQTDGKSGEFVREWGVLVGQGGEVTHAASSCGRLSAAHSTQSVRNADF